MVEETARQLTEFLRDRAGRALRTVVVVQEDEWELYHLRDDLQAEYTRETYAEVVDTFRVDETVLSPDTETAPVGERRAIIHYHDNAFVIQFPVSDTGSVLVSFTSDVGPDLYQLVRECSQLTDR